VIGANLAQIARRLADQQKTQAQAPPADRFVWGTIATVTAGAASDGNALVTVTWRGATVTANGYLSSYTPVAGNRVLCTYIGNQLIVLGRTVGAP
jgi:hypothetical protein